MSGKRRGITLSAPERGQNDSGGCKGERRAPRLCPAPMDEDDRQRTAGTCPSASSLSGRLGQSPHTAQQPARRRARVALQRRNQPDRSRVRARVPPWPHWSRPARAGARGASVHRPRARPAGRSQGMRAACVAGLQGLRPIRALSGGCCPQKRQERHVTRGPRAGGLDVHGPCGAAGAHSQREPRARVPLPRPVDSEGGKPARPNGARPG